jgi:hypothetical protein
MVDDLIENQTATATVVVPLDGLPLAETALPFAPNWISGLR